MIHITLFISLGLMSLSEEVLAEAPRSGMCCEEKAVGKMHIDEVTYYHTIDGRWILETECETCAPSAVSCKTNDNNCRPKQDSLSIQMYVQKAETAKLLAKNAIESKYGPITFPLKAQEQSTPRAIWIVTVELPKDHQGKRPIVVIDKNTGEITHVSLLGSKQ